MFTSAYETAAIVIQKCFRGFIIRKAYQLYRQRLHTQFQCFFQQIELISNEFFTRVVKTNFCTPMKSVACSSAYMPQQMKYAQKMAHCLFPLLPLSQRLPSPLPIGITSPPLPPPDAPTTIKVSTVTSSIPLPPPAPALFLSSRPSPQSRHPLIAVPQLHRSSSPSPSSPIVSKFAQVRDMFARAEAVATGSQHHHHHHHHHQAAHHHQYIPTKAHPMASILSSTNNLSSHPAPSIERTLSPRPVTVLNAVQEYQKQHIKIHQPAHKRFNHLAGVTGALHHRPTNINGNICLRARNTVPLNVNNNNKAFLHSKPTIAVAQPHLSPLPKLQPPPPKPLTRV
jgi:hypothetical protein